MSLFSAIYDGGFSASAAFGAAARQQGHSIHDIEGDVAGFWMDHLAEQWQRAPVAIAGLTHASALFVLERLGWDHGLRVIFRARHDVQAHGHLEHRLSGPAPMLNAFEAAISRDVSLGVCVAGILSHCHAAEQASSATSIMARSRPGAGSDHGNIPLVSWVIAPQSSFASACNDFDTVERIL
ncbi:hypothetical protein PA01_00900 [Azoarcus sp. PA01]|nr:hypothetical protein PA01_20165 [Azoarcus sp. PA01]KON82617.2 hypothetical protein PA01_00900 [Azoarcus sp. PA01]